MSAGVDFTQILERLDSVQHQINRDQQLDVIDGLQEAYVRSREAVLGLSKEFKRVDDFNSDACDEAQQELSSAMQQWFEALKFPDNQELVKEIIEQMDEKIEVIKKHRAQVDEAEAESEEALEELEEAIRSRKDNEESIEDFNVPDGVADGSVPVYPEAVPAEQQEAPSPRTVLQKLWDMMVKLYNLVKNWLFGSDDFEDDEINDVEEHQDEEFEISEGCRKAVEFSRRPAFDPDRQPRFYNMRDKYNAMLQARNGGTSESNADETKKSEISVSM